MSADEEPLTGLAASLARLRPTAGSLDRDRLLYEAGRRSARTPVAAWLGWPAAAVLLGVVVADRLAPPPPRVREASVVRRPAAPPPSPAPAADPTPAPPAYLVMLRQWADGPPPLTPTGGGMPAPGRVPTPADWATYLTPGATP